MAPSRGARYGGERSAMLTRTLTAIPLAAFMCVLGPRFDPVVVVARAQQQPRAEAATPISPTRIPDTPVRDQNGNWPNLYTEPVKGRTVAINFIFTTCTTICPSLTATFRKVQQDLAARAPDVQLISVSVDPITDTPERLRDFAARFGAGPGWTFVTGEK